MDVVKKDIESVVVREGNCPKERKMEGLIK